MDEAIELFALPAGKRAPGDDDYMGKGDIGRWTRFAWSLKARHALRLIYAPGKTKTGQADLVLSYLTKGMNRNSDEISWKHLNTAENRNYFFAKIEQLYIASVWENQTEVWTNFLRTGYPAYNYSYAWFDPISVNPPRRFEYPDREIEDNPNVPRQPDIYSEGITWDKKPGRWIKK